MINTVDYLVSEYVQLHVFASQPTASKDALLLSNYETLAKEVNDSDGVNLL